MVRAVARLSVLDSSGSLTVGLPLQSSPRPEHRFADFVRLHLEMAWQALVRYNLVRWIGA